MKTLIITSCTSSKIEAPINSLKKSDFANKNEYCKKIKQLNSYKAMNLYTGRQHLHLKEGVSLLKESFENEKFDVKIVSAGYGLINENKKIYPYNVSFSNMKAKEIDEWAKKLRIREDLDKAIKDYKLIIFLLGTKYLRALRLPLDNVDTSQRLIFLASKTSKRFIPSSKEYIFLEVSQNDASLYGKNLIELKGYLFKLFANEVVKNGIKTLKDVYKNPDYLLKLIEKYKESSEQLKLFT
ncbi:MAG: DUF6884 domain-containing protein [Bacillota bacterium]